MRKKLFEAGVENFTPKTGENLLLKKKINDLRQRGFTYQKIADVLNFWKVGTRSGEGKWFGKTVRELNNNMKS